MSAAEEPREQVRLRLVECPSCADVFKENALLRDNLKEQGEAVVQMAGRLATLEDGQDLVLAEKEIRRLRRQIGKLNAELADKRRADPRFADAQEVFDYWRKECGKPRSQFTEDRQKAILKALESYTKRELALAILGAKHAPHVNAAGVVFNDVELACRGSNPERFADRYRAYRRSHGLPPLPEDVNDGSGEGTGDAPGAA